MFSLRGTCHGEILATIKQGGEDSPLMGLGGVFNRRVALFSSEQLKRKIIIQGTEKDSRLDRKKILAVLTRQTMDEGVSGVSSFLERLELFSRRPLFEAYRRSRIPSIFLKRREFEERLGAKNPKRKQGELVYPLD